MNIEARNAQYKKLMMSRNSFKLETIRHGQWTFRMLNDNPEYLRERGEEWKRLEMIDDYKVSPK